MKPLNRARYAASTAMIADMAIDSMVFDLAAFGPVDPVVRFAAFFRAPHSMPRARYFGAYPTDAAASAAVADRSK